MALGRVMLQQTRVKTALEYFPTLRARTTTVRAARESRNLGRRARFVGAALGSYRRGLRGGRDLTRGAPRRSAEKKKYGGKAGPGDAGTLREIFPVSGPYTGAGRHRPALGLRARTGGGAGRRQKSGGGCLRACSDWSCGRRIARGVRSAAKFWALAKELVPAAHPVATTRSLEWSSAPPWCLPGRKQPRCGHMSGKRSLRGPPAFRFAREELPVREGEEAPRGERSIWSRVGGGAVSRGGGTRPSRFLRRRAGEVCSAVSWEPRWVELAADKDPKAVDRLHFRRGVSWGLSVVGEAEPMCLKRTGTGSGFTSRTGQPPARRRPASGGHRIRPLEVGTGQELEFARYCFAAAEKFF